MADRNNSLSRKNIWGTQHPCRLLRNAPSRFWLCATLYYSVLDETAWKSRARSARVSPKKTTRASTPAHHLSVLSISTGTAPVQAVQASALSNMAGPALPKQQRDRQNTKSFSSQSPPPNSLRTLSSPWPTSPPSHNCSKPVSTRGATRKARNFSSLTHPPTMRLLTFSSRGRNLARASKAGLHPHTPSHCRLRLGPAQHAARQRPLLQELHQAQLGGRGWQLQAARG
jgi:hypothetical protein